MLRLRTFGGVCLTNQAGELLGGAATQRRLLALLARLAVAGRRGLSRDKLLPLLWPEADQERARHSLTQALYAARRAVGVDDLFLLEGDIRLNPERIRSDAQDFEEMVDAGALEPAIDLYAGPFADGFFLPGSPDFERWISTERARFEDRVAVALEQLAQRADQTGASLEAIAWRKRLAALRPLDTKAAVELMTALARVGDRAGALQHARLHEILLREQLDLRPDSQVTELAARLRERAEWRPAAPGVSSQRGAAASPPASFSPERPGVADWQPADLQTADEPANGAATAPPTVESSRLAVQAPRSIWRPLRTRWPWGLVAVVLVLLPIAYLTRERAPPPAGAPAPPPLDQKVVVAPFRVVGASPSLAYLREGLVELLSTRLADDSSARSVDAGAVLAAWRVAGLGALTGSVDLPRATVARLAADLGAERVVIGSVVGTPSRLVITTAVVDVGSGLVRGNATVEGPADSISALVDRLAGKLLIVSAGDDASLSSQTTASLPALRSFLDGQAAFRRGNYLLALRRYEQSLRLDSTFALAALQLARSADRLGLIEPRVRGIALSSRGRDALDARARALLLAFAGPRYPAATEVDELMASWERVTDLTPDRAEAWYELGARLLDDGAVTGRPDTRSRGLAALERSIRLDPGHEPTYELLAQIGARRPLTAPPDSGTILGPFRRWREAVIRGDSGFLKRFRDTLGSLESRTLRAIALAAQIQGAALGDARTAVQFLRARAGQTPERLDAALAEHSLALNEGRVRDALAATDRLAELRPAAHPELRLRMLDALYGDGDAHAAEVAARAVQRLVAMRPANEPNARATQLADACVLAQWRLRLGDTTGVSRTIERLETDPLRTAAYAPIGSAGPLVCAELLKTALAVTLKEPAAAAAVTRLDSLAFTAAVSGDAVAYLPLLIAHFHEQLGNVRAAFEAVRRRADATGWPRYLASALRHEGRYAAMAGFSEAARQAFGHYLALREGADGELRGQVDEVRRAAAALQ